MTVPADMATDQLTDVRNRSFRAKVAGVWIRVFFGLTTHATWVVRSCRGLFVWLVLFFSDTVHQTTGANARRIFGRRLSESEHADFARRVVGSFCDFICDIGRSVKMTRPELETRIESIAGQHHYDAARAVRNGAVVVTAHMGSFEVGLAALLQRERRVHVVFKRDPFPWFERLRTRMRQRLGVVEEPVDDGWPVWLRLREALLNDEVVVLQGDRVMPGQKGRRVAMLGGHVMLPTGPAKLAMAAGAPVVPIFSVRTQRGGHIRIAIEAPIFVAGLTLDQIMQRIGDTIGRYVLRHPDQWLVLDKAFCEDRGERARAVRPRSS